MNKKCFGLLIRQRSQKKRCHVKKANDTFEEKYAMVKLVTDLIPTECCRGVGSYELSSKGSDLTY